MIRDYLLYRFKSVTEHGVHSPFVFELVTNVIYNQTDYYSFKKIENVREQLLDSKIRQIARQETLSSKYTQLLFRLVNHFQPAQIIELGTSLGISTAYMASANSKIPVITVEDRPEISEIAKKNFEQLELKNIVQLSGDAKTLLQSILEKKQELNFIVFNEKHCNEKTLNYFGQCLEKGNESDLFVFTDIHSSTEMRDAWKEIKNNNKVRVTIDLFFMGLVFFRTGQVKQHFIIKF